MAARGNKNKDHRIPVTDIAHWNKELAFGGIVIAEVFSSWFGPCEALTPTVQQLMLDIDDAPNKMKWLLVNVAKLEEQQLKQRQEEEKKQKENEIAQRRKAEGEGKSDEKDTPASHTSVGSDASAVSIPLLEKYAGYEHPRPLWVFIQDKKVLGEMRSANPPRLRTVLTKYMAGETVDPEVLPEPVLPKEFQAKAAVVAAPVEEAEAHGDSEEAEQEDLEDVDVSNPAAKAAEAENQEAAAKPSEEEAKGAEPASEAAPAPAAEENPAPVSESKAEEAESAAPEEKQPATEEAAPAPAEPEKEKTPSEAPASEAKEPGSKRGTATQAVLTKMGSQLSKGTNSRRSTLNASESKSNKKP